MYSNDAKKFMSTLSKAFACAQTIIYSFGHVPTLLIHYYDCQNKIITIDHNFRSVRDQRCSARKVSVYTIQRVCYASPLRNY